MKTNKLYYWIAGLILNFGIYFSGMSVNLFWNGHLRGTSAAKEVWLVGPFLALAVVVFAGLFLLKKAKPDKFPKLFYAGIAVIAFLVCFTGILPLFIGYSNLIALFGSVGSILFLVYTYVELLGD